MSFFGGSFFGGGFFGGEEENRAGVGNTNWLKKQKISYKRPPTFTEALINEQRAAALAMNLAESAIPIDEPDDDEIDDEILLKALTLRILH